MTMARLVKTSFAAGELDPRLLGRLDLKAQEDGASRLRNVLVQATGGVTRRPGTKFAAYLPNGLRLVGFDGADGGEVLSFAPFRVDVVHAGVVVVSFPAPWSETQLAQLDWARLDDMLLLCHPDVAPQRLTRSAATSWALSPWVFDDADDASAYPALHQPYARFAGADIALQAVRSGASATDPIAAGMTVTLLASAPVFTALHLGTIVRLHSHEVLVTNVQSPTQAIGLTRQALVSGLATRQWDEQAFSLAHGFPRTITFHQDRLAIGGSRDLPDCLWLSRTGRPFDHDPGTGLDDEAIAFRLAADRLQTIVNVCGGRRLEVFTSAGEWVVNGFPVTPSAAQVTQQTGVGSFIARRLPTLDVDGATLFVGSSGRDLREFLYTDTEGVYQAADIALLARHLMRDPVDLTFDQARRLLLIVRGDGSAATVTIDRNSDVVAWSVLEYAGQLRAALQLAGEIFLLVERGSEVVLERLDDTSGADGSVALTSTVPQMTWNVPLHLAGAPLGVSADGTPMSGLLASGGMVTLPVAASTVSVGCSFAHEVEALPLLGAVGPVVALDALWRPVRITLRLLETVALTIDTGGGARRLQFAAADSPFTGDVATCAPAGAAVSLPHLGGSCRTFPCLARSSR